MSKGSNQRPTNLVEFRKNYDRIFKSNSSKKKVKNG